MKRKSQFTAINCINEFVFEKEEGEIMTIGYWDWEYKEKDKAEAVCYAEWITKNGIEKNGLIKVIYETGKAPILEFIKEKINNGK